LPCEPYGVPAQNVAVKAIVTPVLVGGASLAGRRFGHHIGGWLVALPMTSGPVAFFLASDHGNTFASKAAIGMLAGTASQVAFALTYGAAAKNGATRAFSVGALAFAVATVALSLLQWRALPTFALVAAVLTVGFAATKRRKRETPADPTDLPRWDIGVRMVAATSMVVLITTLAPHLGPHLAGLLSPFPVFGAVLAIFAHHTHGLGAATQALDGLVLGLAAPAVFFLLLAITLPSVGLVAFAIATACALVTQGVTMLAIPRD
jgi:hypothetical protein